MTRGISKGLLSATLLLGTAALSGCAVPPRASEVDEPMVRDISFDELGERVPSVATLQSLARVLAAQGNDPQCAIVLRRLIADYPRYTPAYNELAELYLRQNKPEWALQTLRSGLEVAPEDPVLLNNLGMYHVLQEDYDEAIASFAKALETYPEDVRLLGNKAMALGLAGRKDEALALYSEIVTLAAAHRNLAVICEALGEEEEAAHYHALADELEHKPAPGDRFDPTETPPKKH